MPPLLIVFAGLPGTGKSTLARAIAEREDAVWLRVDTLEAAMLRSGLSQSFETGLAAYNAVWELARDELRRGRNAVVDAVNGVEPAREMWRSLARECGASLFFVEVICSDREVHRRRVESRGAQTPPLPAPTWADVLEREYRAWSDPILTIDGIAPVELNIERIVKYLSPERGRSPTRADHNKL